MTEYLREIVERLNTEESLVTRAIECKKKALQLIKDEKEFYLNQLLNEKKGQNNE